MKDTKEESQKELNQVNLRLEILDMIKDGLDHMKRLAERVINEDLTDEEMKGLNKQVQGLKEEVILLDNKATVLS